MEQRCLSGSRLANLVNCYCVLPKYLTNWGIISSIYHTHQAWAIPAFQLRIYDKVMLEAAFFNQSLSLGVDFHEHVFVHPAMEGRAPMTNQWQLSASLHSRNWNNSDIHSRQTEANIAITALPLGPWRVQSQNLDSVLFAEDLQLDPTPKAGFALWSCHARCCIWAVFEDNWGQSWVESSEWIHLPTEKWF